MRKVLATKKLEEKCMRCIREAGFKFDGKHVKFSNEHEKQPGVTYVFTKWNKYHVVKVDWRKEVIKKIKTNDFDNLFYEVIDSGIFTMGSWEHVADEIVFGMDSLRLFFKREVEIFGYFGDYFKERKIKAIRDRLSQYAYDHLENDDDDIQTYRRETVLKGEIYVGFYFDVYDVFGKLGAEIYECGREKRLYYSLPHETVSISFKERPGETEAVFGDGEKTRLICKDDNIYISVIDLNRYLIRVWNRLDEKDESYLCSPEFGRPKPLKRRRKFKIEKQYIALLIILLINLYRVLSVLFLARPFDFNFYIATAPFFVVMPIVFSMLYILVLSGNLIIELVLYKNEYNTWPQIKNVLIYGVFTLILMASAIIEVK